MFQEYDVIIALHDINADVPKGTIGTVLLVHFDIPSKYEIEFIDEQGNSLDVLTVQESEIDYKKWLCLKSVLKMECYLKI